MSDRPYEYSYSHPLGGTNSFSRKFAGNSLSTSIDPYISGYAFIYFASIPKALPTVINSVYGFQYEESQIRNLLASSCLSVTIPGATVNPTELIGLGGIRHQYVANVTYDNTVTMRFIEYSGIPIFRVFHSWIKLMRDYRSGVSPLDGATFASTTPYTKSNYAGSVYYWTTKPDGNSIEFYTCLSGLFPMKDPSDLFGHDITTNDKVEIDIDFSIDYRWHEPWVLDRCNTLMSNYRSAYSSGGASGTIAGYGTLDGQVQSAL